MNKSKPLLLSTESEALTKSPTFLLAALPCPPGTLPQSSPPCGPSCSCLSHCVTGGLVRLLCDGPWLMHAHVLHLRHHSPVRADLPLGDCCHCRRHTFLCAATRTLPAGLSGGVAITFQSFRKYRWFPGTQLHVRLVGTVPTCQGTAKNWF